MMIISDLFSVENLERIATVIGTVLFTLYMSYKTFKNKLNSSTDVSKEIKKQSDLDCSIISEAEKLKEYLKADRIQVYEFHNGMHYANGRSALKTTCTYEVCRFGVDSCLNILSGIPLSIIPNFIKTLLNRGEMMVSDLENIKSAMPSTYNFKKSMNVKSFYDVVIYNKNKEPIGFVAVQFCENCVKDVDIDEIKKFAWFIENQLLSTE